MQMKFLDTLQAKENDGGDVWYGSRLVPSEMLPACTDADMTG